MSSKNIVFKNISVLDENIDVLENRYVKITDDRIAYIGEDICETADAEVYNGKGKLLMSGFYNAHSHAPMNLMRGYAENMKLYDWLEQKVYPFESFLDSESVYWATMLSMAESVKFGIVSSSDMYYFCGDIARAVEESCTKANIARAVAGDMRGENDAVVRIEESMQLYNKFNNAADGRIKVDFSLHGEYSSTPETARALVECAKGLDTVMHVHLSETQNEHQECMERHGITPAAYMEKMGIFDMPAIAAHCVYVTDEDIDILKCRDVTVAANPVSNMKLASGICNVDKIIKKGINVAIGTDGVASNNNLNFIEEMKVLAIGNKANTLNPTVLTPKDVLIAATRGGAIAQGRPDCGAVKEGNKADLIVLDMMAPNMQPIHNMVNSIVYSASPADILMTIVDGKVLYNKGEYATIDIEKTIYNVNMNTKRILERL